LPTHPSSVIQILEPIKVEEKENTKSDVTTTRPKLSPGESQGKYYRGRGRAGGEQDRDRRQGKGDEGQAREED